MFGKRIPLFNLFGFEIRLDWSWIIIAVLITWTLAAGVFPANYPDLQPGTYWSMGVIAALALFGSIILHETAHAAVARRYGLPINGITLFVFGGVAEMEREPDSPGVEFLMAVAGPIASYAIAFVCYMAALGSAEAGVPAPVVGVLGYLALINAIIATFNLVPAFPLDGGRILRAALWRWKGEVRWATQVTSAIGAGFGLLLIVLGVWRVLLGDFIGGMWWFLIGLFVRQAAQMSYQQVVVREGLRGVPVHRIMSRDPVTVPPSVSLAQLVDDWIYRHHYKMFPVVEDGRLVGCISLRDVKEVPRENWAETSVAAIMRGCGPENSVSPDQDALAALTVMHRTQNGRLLVIEGGRLVGVVTMKDMLKFLSLKLDLEGESAAGRGLFGLGSPDRAALRAPDTGRHGGA
jgi:Zn-dependent protease/predicted transcriptional regulator